MKMRKACTTDAGMWGVWDYANFRNIKDYESWEAELLDDSDIIRHINAGHFVPVNIYTDGCFEFEVRAGRAGNEESLTDREKRYLTVSSKTYLLRSSGQICFGGYEYVSNTADEGIGCFSVPKGDYSVTVHMIEWSKEPGTKDSKGNPTADALPDFVIIANPVVEKNFKPCVSIDTFPS